MTRRFSAVGFHPDPLPWAITTDSTVVAEMSNALGNADHRPPYCHRPTYCNTATSYASTLTRDGLKEPGV